MEFEFQKNEVEKCWIKTLITGLSLKTDFFIERNNKKKYPRFYQFFSIQFLEAIFFKVIKLFDYGLFVEQKLWWFVE